MAINMATDRLEYLIKKCKLQLDKKRKSEARAWLEIALDEFPSNRELQRFAGKTYLQLGFTQKAIHFIEFKHTDNIVYDSAEGYMHDRVTEDDLNIIQQQLDSTNVPSFVSPILDVERATPTRKTLALNNNVLPSRARNIEESSVYSSHSGQSSVLVKHLKTKKTPSASRTSVTNKSSSDTKASLNEIETGDKETIHAHVACTPSESSVSKTEPVNSLSEHIEDFEFHTESEHDAFHEHSNIHEDNTQYETAQISTSEQTLSSQDIFQPSNCELEWTQDPLDLQLFQDDEFLLDFDEEGFDLFDASDDALVSAFREFNFEEECEEEQQPFAEEDEGNSSKLTRWERAQQIAVEVIYSTNWSGKNLAFLTDVFYENGWGATRVTIEKEILSGTTIDELMLARDFKEIWKNCDRYWITLSKLGPTAHVTEATHRQMSWAQTMKIIRCFNWLPSIEELEVFLEDEFEYWYQHTLMRRVFPVFMKYLCYYRAKSTPYMDFESRPYQPDLTDDPMDKGDFINCNSENRQRLHEIGLDAIKVNIH